MKQSLGNPKVNITNTPPKTKMTMEKQRVESMYLLLKHGVFPASHVCLLEGNWNHTHSVSHVHHFLAPPPQPLLPHVHVNAAGRPVHYDSLGGQLEELLGKWSNSWFTPWEPKEWRWMVQTYSASPPHEIKV